jgi:hypothetical protein
VHPIQIAKWRKCALEQFPELFVDGRKGRNGEAASDALYEEIGRLKVKLDEPNSKSLKSLQARTTKLVSHAGPKSNSETPGA